MSQEYTPFPPLPNGLVIDPKLGPLFDRMQMQSYALKMADAATLRQAVRVDEADIDVLRRLRDALPTVGLNGWTAGVGALDAAIAVLSAQPAPRQYFYKVDGCTAPNANDPSCRCWHDEGTGPLPDGDAREWRDKTSQPAERQGEVYAAHPSGDGCIVRKGDGVRLSADEIIAVMNHAAPVGVPDGWKLVPIEPTDAMREAAEGFAYSYDLDDAWDRMLAAAPSAPQGEG